MLSYTTDTHSLVWHFTDSVKLGKKAKQSFALAERGKALIYVPTIVMAEIFFITRKKHIVFDYSNFLNNVTASPNYALYPLDTQLLFKLPELESAGDLHDQIIVAVAKLTSSSLITKDREIVESGVVDVVW